MTVEINEQNEAHGHEHKDVSGGWLRPAVFGAMDGLVTNVSLIAGVGAGVGASGGSPHFIVLTGLAGLAAGAFSMATGEYVSVSSQNELIDAEVRKEAHELEHNARSEQMELAASFRRQGVEADLADQVAAQISANPEHALGVHVREELGVDHQDLPSPYTAAGASLVTFAVGALIPLLPYLLGLDNLAVALGLAAVAAFVGGGLVARLTDRPFLRGALRQLHPGRRRRRDHVPDRQRGRRRGLLNSGGGLRAAHPDCRRAGRTRPPGRSAAGRTEPAGVYQASGPNASSSWPPGPDSSFRSDSTIIVISSSNPTWGSQPSRAAALAGSAQSWSTSAGRTNAASTVTWSCQSSPATANARSTSSSTLCVTPVPTT